MSSNLARNLHHHSTYVPIVQITPFEMQFPDAWQIAVVHATPNYPIQ